MVVTGVLRPGHVTLRILDPEAAVDHCVRAVGLIETGRDDRGHVDREAWDEHDHHGVVLRGADRRGMDCMGRRADSRDARAESARNIAASGRAAALQWIAAGEHPGTGRRLRFTVPTGHAMALFADKEKVGNGMPDVHPEPRPEGLVGMRPARSNHRLLDGDDLDGTVQLLTEVSGSGIAERVMAGDTGSGARLACATKVHDVAFLDVGT